jgi:hypothetical protein
LSKAQARCGTRFPQLRSKVYKIESRIRGKWVSRLLMQICILLLAGVDTPASAQDAAPLTRPVMPDWSSIPPVPLPVDCADPAKRKALLAGREAWMETFTSRIDRALAYPNDYAEWRASELIRRGYWTEAQRASFWPQLTHDPAIVNATDQGLAQLKSFYDSILDAGQVEKRGDANGACFGAIKSLTAVHAVLDSLQRQAKAVEGAFAKEGARLGVTLD